MATLGRTNRLQELETISGSFPPNQAKSYSLNLVLLGPPGAGKGTQAEKLCRCFDLQHVATGDLFRENLNQQTELGKLAKSYMDRGELVPDDVTEAMVRERLSRPDVAPGFILDGFPRTLPQARALTNIMIELNRQLAGVLYFKVPLEELVTRLAGRRICRKCQTPFHERYNPFRSCPLKACQGEYLYQRDDDQPDVVRARLETYSSQTAPLIDYYKKQGLLIELDGEQDISEVTARAMAAIERLTPAWSDQTPPL